MHLLLVNDDGIDSPLLHTLAREAKARGHLVTVCAPAMQQSAKSHAFTVFTPLLASRRTLPCADAAWAVKGTPVDCARLGLLSLAGENGAPPVDFVLSGINLGYNVGLATYVSGTVGAAREAAFMQNRAIAVSVSEQAGEAAIARAAACAVTLAEHADEVPLPPQCVLNLNVPPVLMEPKPVLCDINRVVYRDGYERRTSPRGVTYFWLEPEQEITQPTPNSDLDWLRRGVPTLSLLTPDGCRVEPSLTYLTEQIEFTK